MKHVHHFLSRKSVLLANTIGVLFFSMLFINAKAQKTDCASCNEQLKTTLKNDALIKQYNSGSGQANSYKAIYRTLDITLKMCGQCMSEIDRESARETMAQTKELITSLGSDVPVFRYDPNYKRTQPAVKDYGDTRNTPNPRTTGESGHVD